MTIIITWNLLSQKLTDYMRTSSHFVNKGNLFDSKWRCTMICHIIDNYMKTYYRPIFCFQEVNDGIYDESFMKTIETHFQIHYYMVYTSSYGKSGGPFKELGLMTAIPDEKYEVIDVMITKIDRKSELFYRCPNTCICLKLMYKDHRMITFNVVNVHFPARYKYTEYMSSFTEQFLDIVAKFAYPDTKCGNIIIGDFNTQMTDVWYNLFEKYGYRHSITDERLRQSIISTRAVSEGDNIFEGLIDHSFHQNIERSGLLNKTYLLVNRLEMKILPNEKMPSDHFPLVMKYYIFGHE